MRDTSKQIRLAVFTALTGNIGYPVYDEKRLVSATDDIFVVLGTQQEVPTNDTDCTWINRSAIDIEIQQRTGSEVSKDTIDDISNAILTILIPVPFVTNIMSVNLQFQLANVDSIISRNVSISDTESVLVKVIRFVVTIVQQI